MAGEEVGERLKALVVEGAVVFGDADVRMAPDGGTVESACRVDENGDTIGAGIELFRGVVGRVRQ